MNANYYARSSSSPFIRLLTKSFLFSFLGLFGLGLAVRAQMVNKDSLSLVSKIQSDREKLTKLQNSVPDAEKQKKETAEQAQESADDNRKAANKLSNDPQDRKLARRADSEAGDARSDAKRARKAADNLEELNKNIRNLTERIAKNQTRLNKYIQANKNYEAAPTVAIPKDSVGN
jgi:cell division septum initiation protein DivIVA